MHFTAREYDSNNIHVNNGGDIYIIPNVERPLRIYTDWSYPTISIEGNEMIPNLNSEVSFTWTLKDCDCDINLIKNIIDGVMYDSDENNDCDTDVESEELSDYLSKFTINK